MGTVRIGDTVRATARMSGPANQEVDNVFYYKSSLSQDTSDENVMNALAAHLDGMYGDQASDLSNKFTSTDIQFYNMSQDRPMGTGLWDAFIGGLSIVDPLPEGVAALISASTGTKRVTPKKYFAAFCENASTTGEWTPAIMAVLGDMAIAWLTDVVVGPLGSMIPGTWQRVTRTFVPLIAATVRSVCSYQRRRKPAVGA